MISLWDEAIGSINAYIKGLPAKTKVTADLFDTGSYGDSNNYVRVRDTTVNNWQDINTTEYSPRGGTPLNDAAGRLLTEVLAAKDKKAVVIIMTDGYENASKEFTLAQVKELIKKVEARGFEVIFLGANFDNAEQQAQGYGVSLNKTMNVRAINLENTMIDMAKMTTAYMSGSSASINLDAGTKAAAVK
jgi:ADP-heptose:LPS heptosyltransferase